MRELQFVSVSPDGERNVLLVWFMRGENPRQVIHELHIETSQDSYHWTDSYVNKIILPIGSHIVLEDVTKPEWPTPIELI